MGDLSGDDAIAVIDEYQYGSHDCGEFETSTHDVWVFHKHYRASMVHSFPVWSMVDAAHQFWVALGLDFIAPWRIYLES